MYQVFLADDEPWVLLGLRNLIDWSAEGFVICGEATDGHKAWDRICRLEPDLILSDIQMPGLTGIELIEKIRENDMTTEVMFISGYSEFEYARAGMRLGCAEYLLKPIYSEDLLAALHKVRERLKKQAGADEEAKDTAPQSAYVSERRMAEQMLQYMQEHYSELTQQQLAQQFCMSTSAASQMIKKYTGKNYSAHLLDLRIQKAQELLQTTDESIAQIAERVGYNDYFYFVKVFKKATGISPSVYRKEI